MRDFTYVGDVAEANILAAESSATGIFNLGNSQRVTINELTRDILKLVGNDSLKPVYHDPRPGDVLHSLADITRAKTFGYDPKYTLKDGLKVVFDTFKK